MRVTLALQWKALIDKIHPSLPISFRQSRTVLKALDSSFQNQLDMHHPIDEAHPTSNHITTLLGNPLFLKKSLLKVSRREEPLVRMENAIAQGFANLYLVKDCLRAHFKDCNADQDPRKAMEDSEAAKLILHWLWSSGNSRTFQHLADPQLTRLIVHFLVAKREYNMIHHWIQLGDDTLEGSSDSRKIPGRTLLELVVSESRFGGGFQSALLIFYEYVRKFASCIEKERENRSRLLYTLRPAGRYLVNTIASLVREGKLSADDYDKFVGFAKLWTCRVSYERAWLELHHPSRPSPDAALKYLQDMNITQSSALARTGRRNNVKIGIQTAELLLSQGRQQDAALVMEILKQHFPDAIGYRGSVQKIEKSEPEGAETRDLFDLRLLESLTTG
ncbi:uncharacterized protein KY384_000783 [Bacidia gigantensis]|uniref:uncharacterized protein n=1 Tax=Bacidia gigantensis TaxID=2732470 RepID=UPI001D059845|nr:uncharacterized protein KY384_000783 [Bacidia gigantensis]KAG8526021.1 hypothetical protein KY384_000783 [Bacidia gigantensis]